MDNFNVPPSRVEGEGSIAADGDTIANNIAYGSAANVDDEALLAACKTAHAHEFIKKLPKGYDTLIGENGSLLSGGQRQRLSIARAMLRQAPILLLDEATSALDSHSEALVRDALENITTGVTTIVIAHRLSTVMNADKICYLEAGRVIEQGTISELIAAKGKFNDLYNMQFSGTTLEKPS